MINVLVVEDNLSQRQMLSALLTKLGLNVTEASNGSDALYKICTQCPGLPDLIVLDIVMPLMNGYEVCRYLKSHPKTHQVPVVLCSAKAEQLDRYWGMKQGADAYISKPFHPQELLGTLRQVLRGRQVARVAAPNNASGKVERDPNRHRSVWVK